MSETWLDELNERLGPLRPAAAEFLRWRGLENLQPGSEGARRLADELDAFAHDLSAPDDADDRFLEGAGALLGALLVASITDARHAPHAERHGLSLGPYGYFDPFAAIDAALDADDPRAALAEAIRRAEAEARGEGPHARAVRSFDELLSLKRPDLALLRHRGTSVHLGDGIEVELAEAMHAGADDDADLEVAICRLIDLLPGGDEADAANDWSYARRKLLPRLVGAPFLRELDARGGAPLYRAPLVGNVHVCLVLADRDRARFVRDDERDCWGVTDLELEAAYLARLAERSRSARFDAVETDEGVMVVARSGDALDSARLLLPGLHGVLCRELSPPLWVSVPHRDTLLAVGGVDASMRDALTERTRLEHARAPHGISAQVFELGRRGPRLPG